MPDTARRCRILGRRLHPVGLGCSVLAVTMTVTILIGHNDAGRSLDTSIWGVAGGCGGDD